MSIVFKYLYLQLLIVPFYETGLCALSKEHLQLAASG